MISGVALVLAGETRLLESDGLGVWLGGFVIVNALYLPLVESPRSFAASAVTTSATWSTCLAGFLAGGRGANRRGPVAGAPSVAGL